MSKLQKLKYINNVSKGWKLMFELYDWVRWTNENNYDSYADYNHFMKFCEDEILRLGLRNETIPRFTKQENWVSRYFYLSRRFKNIRDMQKLLDHDTFKIDYIRNKIHVRFKDYDKQ